ncbi:hypothetical protein LTR01_003659 [Friedmanniomyces endolithicus]|nr:hypothetical protein LTR01_003659 [Friedmanniomyces endolithicus]KAK0835856.1 hypothetical protein LTR73_000357 [Friedmanniomyces endolithicus]
MVVQRMRNIPAPTYASAQNEVVASSFTSELAADGDDSDVIGMKTLTFDALGTTVGSGSNDGDGSGRVGHSRGPSTFISGPIPNPQHQPQWQKPAHRLIWQTNGSYSRGDAYGGPLGPRGNSEWATMSSREIVSNLRLYVNAVYEAERRDDAKTVAEFLKLLRAQFRDFKALFAESNGASVYLNAGDWLAQALEEAGAGDLWLEDDG